MKKRKLLETLKELIETNAQLSAQNEELWARVGKNEDEPTEISTTEQSQSANKDYEKLESDNRILSQELIEAKAKILELTKQLETTSSLPREESVASVSPNQETAEAETNAPVDNFNEIIHAENSYDNVDIFISLSPSSNTEPQAPESNKIDYIVNPITNCDNTTDTADETATSKADTSADITDWQIDMASQYIGKAIIMITEFNNEIADSTSENKQDLITLALGKSEGFKAEIVDAISACETPEAAEAAAEKRIDELKRYINALRLSV